MDGIPASLQVIFEKIKAQALWLTVHWTIYKELFNHSKERFEMLHECDPAAFWSFQIALETEILMSLSRLTDLPGKGDKEVLSFERLHRAIADCGERELARVLRSTHKDLRKKCKRIRDHRNTRLAHLDLKISMNEGPTLDPISVRMIEDAVASIHGYMGTFEHHYRPDTEFQYEVGIRASGKALISVIKNGMRFQELVKEKKIDPAERRKGKWIRA